MAASLALSFKITRLHVVNGLIRDVFSNAFDIMILFFGAMLVLENSITLASWWLFIFWQAMFRGLFWALHPCGSIGRAFRYPACGLAMC